MEQATTTYWQHITRAARSLLAGLRLTLSHFWKARRSRKPVAIFDNEYFKQPDGIATVQYPHAILPVPDNGRYRLHNEIDDCIVCDKCAKVCPVNCINIEPIKSTEEIGKTSDGTPKRIYAAKFDIDMAKCCFCGLCTTVCPTECLTMTKVYDFSVLDIRDHNFAFSEMSTNEVEEKKLLWEQHQKQKAATVSTPVVQATTTSTQEQNQTEAPKQAKPVFKPRIKPPDKNT
jgi:formate hydrogenlyase subunit 6/NADH:ubiquinone oxidoreductase subunit I